MPTTLLDGLCFPEGPRWRNGLLYFSDMHAGEVIALDLQGNRETVCDVPNRPSGLGWLPDGRMLIVSMLDRALLRREADGTLAKVADMSRLASFHTNDMVVDAFGNAYIGNFGYDLHGASPVPKDAELIRVRPDGHVEVVATAMRFPNGTVITPDGGTLIVAESMADRLTAFDLRPDGRLKNRRVWAALPPGTIPDGICLDVEGCVWVASVGSNSCLRVRAGGEIAQRLAFDQGVFACTLGGEDMKTLFVATAGASIPEACRANRDGRIEMIDVDVAGTGSP
jgi:sugar lactone lactonase YvrE